MEQLNKGKFEKRLESTEGLAELKEFLHSREIYYDVENEKRVLKRLTLMASNLGLASYSDFIIILQNEPRVFNDLTDWLQRGKIYDEEKQAFIPLIYRNKYHKVTETTPKRRKRKIISQKGWTKIKRFLEDNQILIFQNNESRIMKRLEVFTSRYELDNFFQLHSLLRKDSELFDELVDWLERGRIYDEERRTYFPLIHRKKAHKELLETAKEISVEELDGSSSSEEKKILMEENELPESEMQLLDSKKGLGDLLAFLEENKIQIIPQYEKRIIKRLDLLVKRLNLSNFVQLHVLLKSDLDALEDLVDWLDRGREYDIETKTFSPLIQLNGFPKRNIRKKKQRKYSKIAQEFISLMPDPADEENLTLIFEFLSEKDINYLAYKEKYFHRRLLSRMMRVNTSTYLGYRKYLEGNPDEIDNLIASLSINFTRFFRDKDLYHKIEHDLLPKILNQPANVKIWSAGCAIGAEPYSIEILINDINKESLDRVKLFATDISEELLDRAKVGIFSKELLTEMDNSRVRSYFKPLEEDLYQIKPKIRDSVIFQYHDLREPPPFRELDLILCRNVLIYFSRPQAIILFKRFHEVLKPSGYLIIGKSEVVPMEIRGLFKILDSRARIYQKRLK